MKMSEQYEFAGFWRRFAAVFIDAIILMLIAIPVAIVFGIIAFILAIMGSDGGASLAGLLGEIVGGVVGAFYYIYLVASKHGGTYGKRAMGIAVVNENGETVSIKVSAIRYLCSMISGLILYIGYIMVAFHPQKRALHDIIAGTYVVKVR